MLQRPLPRASVKAPVCAAALARADVRVRGPEPAVHLAASRPIFPPPPAPRPPPDARTPRRLRCCVSMEQHIRTHATPAA